MAIILPLPFAVRLIKTIRKKNPSLQLLMFSATFNSTIREFAQKIAPRANQVYIPRQQLSLEVIKQYNVRCGAQHCAHIKCCSLYMATFSVRIYLNWLDLAETRNELRLRQMYIRCNTHL
jgi:superfamily II DNA/RNA helicase